MSPATNPQKGNHKSNIKSPPHPSIQTPRFPGKNPTQPPKPSTQLRQRLTTQLPHPPRIKPRTKLHRLSSLPDTLSSSLVPIAWSCSTIARLPSHRQTRRRGARRRKRRIKGRRRRPCGLRRREHEFHSSCVCLFSKVTHAFEM